MILQLKPKAETPVQNVQVDNTNSAIKRTAAILEALNNKVLAAQKAERRNTLLNKPKAFTPNSVKEERAAAKAAAKAEEARIAKEARDTFNTKIHKLDVLRTNLPKPKLSVAVDSYDEEYEEYGDYTDYDFMFSTLDALDTYEDYGDTYEDYERSTGGADYETYGDYEGYEDYEDLFGFEKPIHKHGTVKEVRIEALPTNKPIVPIVPEPVAPEPEPVPKKTLKVIKPAMPIIPVEEEIEEVEEEYEEEYEEELEEVEEEVEVEEEPIPRALLNTVRPSMPVQEAPQEPRRASLHVVQPYIPDSIANLITAQQEASQELVEASMDTVQEEQEQEELNEETVFNNEVESTDEANEIQVMEEKPKSVLVPAKPTGFVRKDRFAKSINSKENLDKLYKQKEQSERRKFKTPPLSKVGTIPLRKPSFK